MKGWALASGGLVAIVVVVVLARRAEPPPAAPVSGSTSELAASAPPPSASAASAPAIEPAGEARVAEPEGTLAADPSGEPATEPPSGDLPRTPSVLVARLESSDPHVVLDAADGLAARKVTSAIPALAALDIRKSADSAPSIIDALGRLAGDADPAGRSAATRRLLELLAQEKARDAPESPGNILALYEALGLTRDPTAAGPLEAELADATVTRAAKGVVVASLVKLAQPSSRAALLRAQKEAASGPAQDALEEEVRRELLTTIDGALRALP